MSKKITCFGCGCELQNTDPNATGYTPKIIDGETVLCQRCYRLQHYGESHDEALLAPDYKSVFSKLMKNNALIFYVVDLFALESSIIQELTPFIKDSPILVVANKRDILPRDINDNKLREFVYNKFLAEGIKVKDVICSSAFKNYNIDEIIEAGKKWKHGNDVYIVGASSVGKSSLINCLLKNIKNETRNLISTSPYPGTTVQTITIPIDNKSNIYDTPGIVPYNTMYACMEKSVLKYIIPKTTIKPIIYQLNAKQSIFMGGVARFDFVEGPRSGFTFYLSNNVDLHRTKLDKADSVFDTLVQQAKIKPISTQITSSACLKRHEFVLPEDKNVDIVIFGLGWINVKGKGQKVAVWTPQGVNVIIRDAKI